MKRLILSCLMLSGCVVCGYTATNSQAVGQVKKVEKETPLLCGDWYAADVSLGVLRNGVGSMSREDAWFEITSLEQLELLRSATESGAIVKIEYDEQRAVFCRTNLIIRTVGLAK